MASAPTPSPALSTELQARWTWVKSPEFLSIALAVMLVSLARCALVTAGPDLDTDAYGHAMAGRRLLLEPFNLRIHWVWLPAIHGLHALLTQLGWGLQGVRFVNVLLSALGPMLLWLLLRREDAGTQSEPIPQHTLRRWISALAPVLMATEPITLFLGASGQPEPLFQCLILSACLGWSRGWPIAAGVLLSAATLTRYEAWILPPVFLLLWAQGPRSCRRLSAFALPVLAISSWCFLQYLSTREWGHFFRLNTEFAAGYWAHNTLPRGLVGRALWYCLEIPLFRMFGWPFLLAPLGLGWWFRRGPKALGYVGVAVLVFISWGFLTQRHLGLDRHAAVLVPCYATLLAAGLLRVAQLVAEGTQSWAKERDLPGSIGKNWPSSVTALLVGALLIWLLAWNTIPRFWYVLPAHRAAQSSAAAAAQLLRSLDPPRIYCDMAVIEVLANLPPDRYQRWRLNDLSTWQLEKDWARYPSIIAASSPARLAHLRSRGIELYSDDQVLVLRLDRAAPPPTLAEPNSKVN